LIIEAAAEALFLGAHVYGLLGGCSFCQCPARTERRSYATFSRDLSSHESIATRPETKTAAWTVLHRGMELSAAVGVDAGDERAASTTTLRVRAVNERPVPAPDEIEIPLELVGCDERLPTRVENAWSPRRRRVTTTDAPLSPLHEEELTVTSSSSSSSQLTSPGDDDEDRWTACCTDQLVTDPCQLTAADGSRRLPVEDIDVEVDPVPTGSTVASTVTPDSTTTVGRTHHHNAPRLTARLGNLLNSAVMKAQKQLGRGRSSESLDRRCSRVQLDRS